MDIKAIVFDADGVVINSPDYFSIQYEKELGVSNDIIQPFFKGRFRDCVVGKADLKEELALLLDDWEWKGSPESLMKYWFKAEHYIDERVVNEIKMLKQRGIKCYLGTQQEKYRMEYIKKEMGFKKIFDKSYSSCDIGYEKSEKQFFEYIFDDLNRNKTIKPEEIMFWDDKQSIVNVAKESGWQGYLYANFDDFHKIISQI